MPVLQMRLWNFRLLSRVSSQDTDHTSTRCTQCEKLLAVPFENLLLGKRTYDRKIGPKNILCIPSLNGYVVYSHDLDVCRDEPLFFWASPFSSVWIS